MSELSSITEYRITEHALFEMARRGVSEAEVAQVLSEPEQSETVRPRRKVFQSQAIWGEPPKTFLLRVFVDTDRQPPEVVTVYRTSKVSKYWRD